MNGALPAVLTHLSIGSVYAWSVISKPAAEALSVSVATLAWTFSIAIFFVGTSAAFAGKYIDRMGPCRTLRYSALLYGGGLLLAALALYLKSVWLLFVGYGVVGGIGIGLGYLAPMKNLLQWFHNRKGLATGIAVMGFGFASFLAAPLIQLLIERIGLPGMLIIMGISYAILIGIASFLLVPIQQGTPTQAQLSAAAKDRSTIDLPAALRMKEFYALWIMFFINILAGISLISNAAIMLRDTFTELTPMAAAGIVGMMAVCNGAGRLIWSFLSDYAGRPVIYSGILFLQIFLFLGLARTENLLIYQVLLYVIISCYGAGFSCLPAYISDLFGLRYVNSIFGVMLTAWALAGALGGWLIAQLYQATDSYSLMLYLMTGMLAVALLVSIVPWRAMERKR